MKSLALLVCCIALNSIINAQSTTNPPKVEADTAFYNRANVVTREENIELEVTDIDRFTYTVHKVFTILNENGKDALDFVQYTNKYISLDEAEIKVYDMYGKQTDRYKKKDMRTVATGEGLIEDGYVTYFSVTAPKYPVTLEFNYQLKFKGTVNYPPYEIMSSAEAVDSSSFTAKVLKELDLRYKNQNTDITPVITEDGKYKIYKWSVKHLKPLEYEEGAAKYSSRYPSVQFAPNKFSYYGNEGELSSWQKFGEWISNLYTGLDDLPQGRKDFFVSMVKDVKTDREKEKLIYEYMQKNFRYVSIQLGIGGLKPFSAEFTDQKKYGDCKGLSNYMKAALKAVGIKSYVAIINAEYNSEPVDPAFPKNGFNHVILCIPQQKDTTWLECTSNTNDFGVLGTFTENRNALLITEEGGKLVATPKSKASDNIFSAATTVKIEPDGSGLPVMQLVVNGEYKDDVKHSLFDEKKDDQKDFLMGAYGIKHPDDFEVEKNENPAQYGANIKLAMGKVPEFIAGNKMFLAPRLYKLWQRKLPKAENRRLDFYFNNPFIKTDTTIYQLPDGYIADALPAAKNISCEYGSFITKYWFDADKKAVYSTARLELTQLRIPAAKYAGVKTFFDDVLKEDAQRIVIKKQ